MSGRRFVFIGRTRTGEAWHYIPRPGTAFPRSACGRDIDRRTYRTVDVPAAGIAFHPWQCDKCRGALTKETAPPCGGLTRRSPMWGMDGKIPHTRD